MATVLNCIPTPGITCSELEDPKNGSVRVSGTTIGSRADYKCNSGFKLEGVAWRRCLDNGEWTGEAPVCKSKIPWYTVIKMWLQC